MGKEGIGCIAFSPLAQGLLSNRYLEGIPSDSRAALDSALHKKDVSARLAQIRALNDLAKKRGQSLAQMALAWVLRDNRVTSALIGTSSVKQLEDDVAALDNLEFSAGELRQIDDILAGKAAKKAG